MATRRTVITRPAFRLLGLLPVESRQRAVRALRWLESDPEPDGVLRVKLPEAFPHRPNTYEGAFDGIAIAYQLTDDELVILAVRVLW